jgi:DNA-binding NtrC family response regulator
MLPPPLNTLPFTPVASTMTAKTAPNTPIKNNVPQNSDIFTPTNVIRPLWLVEKETIENAIKACDGNIPRAAALLEVSPSTIYRKRQSWQENEQEIEPV